MNSLSFAGIKLVENAFIPREFVGKVAKGPYYKRRLRRAERDPRNYKYSIFMIDGNLGLCHPEGIRLLLEDIKSGKIGVMSNIGLGGDKP